MVLYRCAACGSPNVMLDESNDGIKYDYVKGAIGTVVLGAGGAVAGVSNQTKQVFKCRDCGMELSYPLGEPYKSLIDVGVATAAGRKSLNINGFPISWDTIVKKFPNIEKGAADSEIESDTAIRQLDAKLTAQHLVSLWRINHANDMEFLKKSNTEIEEEQSKWEKIVQQLEEQREVAFQSAIREKENEINSLNAQKIAEMVKLDDQKDVLMAEIKELQAKLSTLGVFKFAEKSALKNKIAENSAKIQKLQAEITAVAGKCDSELSRLQMELTTFKKVLESKLAAIYAAPENPKDRLDRLQKEQKQITTGVVRHIICGLKFQIISGKILKINQGKKQIVTIFAAASSH